MFLAFAANADWSDDDILLFSPRAMAASTIATTIPVMRT